MTAAQREAWLIVLGHVLELLEGTPALGEASGAPPADLTCREAGVILGRAASTIRGWLESGELEGYLQRGREWRVPRAAVERFQQRERERGKPGAPRPRLSRRPEKADLSAWRKAAS